MWMDLHRCLHRQWVTLWETNTDLRKQESSIRSSKHAGPLLWRKTLSLSSKVVHYTNILGKKKKSLELTAISTFLARYVEIQETRGKLSLNKELPPRWFYLQFLSCDHLKELGPNQNTFSENLDKEESVLCRALQKQTLRWRSICKWFIKEIIPEQSSKRMGKPTLKEGF